MKTKRLISLLLAAVFALSAAATPALAASAGSELPDLTTAGVDVAFVVALLLLRFAAYALSVPMPMKAMSSRAAEKKVVRMCGKSV